MQAAWLSRTALFYDRLCGWIDLAARGVITVLLFAIFALLLAQIALRYLFGTPVFWGLELTGYMFAYVTLLGTSICIRTDEHIRMPLIMDALPGPFRRGLFILVQVFVIFYAWHLVRYGYMFASLGAGERSPSSYFILFWPRLALVIGGVLIILQALAVIARELTGVTDASRTEDASGTEDDRP